MPDADAMRELIANLSPEEQAVLPSRLRALVRSAEADAWASAKAERDAAIAAFTDPTTGLYTDPDAVAAARAAWAARKAELLAQGA